MKMDTVSILGIEPGVAVEVKNPDWWRKYEIVSRAGHNPGDVNPPRRFYLCRFTEQKENCRLTWFGVANAGNVNEGGYTIAWPILKEEEVKRLHDNGQFLIEEGEQRLQAHACPQCKRFVDLKETSRRRLGPEAILINYKCPLCGYKDQDLLD